MQEYGHALKTKDIELEEFLCQYECFAERPGEEMNCKIAEYEVVGSLYYETKGESQMTASEYLEAKK